MRFEEMDEREDFDGQTGRQEEIGANRRFHKDT